MRIIKMEACHAGELAELDKVCFAVPWSENLCLEEDQSRIARYFLAVEGDKIIGYSGIWLVADEGQITNIAVLPEFRKKGVASRLLERLIEEAADAKRIVLEVRESNCAAIALYEKFGFKNAGMRKNFYREPTENAIIMIRGET